ncbi:MAG TPA: ABC transporter permease [Balneolales bacterium]|nr:ABC transporter permease [Balneolales bacterium]
MKFTNLFKIAFRSLGKNKIRTFLTMLGIIIGVASVIAVLAIGQGSRNSIQEQIKSLGTNMIIVFSSSQHRGGVSSGAGTTQRLTVDDALAIAKQCPDIQYVTPEVSTGGQVMYGANNWHTNVDGVYSSYFGIRKWKIKYGEYFNQVQESRADKVCLLGQTVVDNLFGSSVDPVGKYIRIDKIPFKVIGTLQKRGQNGFGRDEDDVIIAPFSTVRNRMNHVRHIHLILASAVSDKYMSLAMNEIGDVLMSRHKISNPENADFTIRTQVQFEQAADATSKILTILLTGIASISLIVGGIGIMNIMFVSVTERTREIGIRLAIGARGKDVLLQFLIESILISFIGGFIGMAVGLISTNAVNTFMHWPVQITTNSIILAFVFSAMIGIFFGWYPARKAANLNPIDALRYE